MLPLARIESRGLKAISEFVTEASLACDFAKDHFALVADFAAVGLELKEKKIRSQINDMSWSWAYGWRRACMGGHGISVIIGFIYTSVLTRYFGCWDEPWPKGMMAMGCWDEPWPKGFV